MFEKGTLRVFLVGVFCGAIVLAAVWAFNAWQPHPKKLAPTVVRQFGSDGYHRLYDQCLAQKGGNAVACDAWMRTVDHELAREKQQEAELRRQVARLLEAGKSKREIIQWAFKQGYYAKQLSDVLGIPLEDIQAGKY